MIRALALLEMLQSRASIGGAELARALHIDRRSLRRHIGALEELGIPVTTTLGCTGGYQLVPGFKLPPMMFTDDEALALAVGLLAARGLGLGHSLSAVASARAKIERVLPQKLKSKLISVDETIELELARPVAALNEAVLSLLTTATQERRRVRLAYKSPHGDESRRDFDPYGLVYRAGHWYTVGWCHLRRGLRTFRLDRVSSASVIAGGFERPVGFDTLEFLKSSIARLPRAHRVAVLLATDLATARQVLFSAFGVLECVEKGVLLRSETDDLNWFARELGRLPFDFDIRSPPALRTAVAKAGRRLLKLAAAPESRSRAHI